MTALLHFDVVRSWCLSVVVRVLDSQLRGRGSNVKSKQKFMLRFLLYLHPHCPSQPSCKEYTDYTLSVSEDEMTITDNSPSYAHGSHFMPMAPTLCQWLPWG